MALGLEAVIVHPSGVIGPHDHGPSRMGRVFLELYHRSLPSLVDGGFDFVDVRDVVAGMLVAAERGQPGANYILNGHDHRVAGLARLAEQVTGVRAPRITAPIRALRLGTADEPAGYVAQLAGWARTGRWTSAGGCGSTRTAVRGRH